MLNRIEHARVRTTGDRVLVLRRHGIARDLDIMNALEAAGAFVIGTPGGFKYAKPDAKAGCWMRPAPDAVFVLDAFGRADLDPLSRAYFDAHYEIIPALAVVDGGAE